MAETVMSKDGARGGREARRRRITERGADRLAFITGHIKSLPSDPLPPPDFVPIEDAISTEESLAVAETLPESECSGKTLEAEQQYQSEQCSDKTSLNTREIYASVAASDNITTNSSLAQNEETLGSTQQHKPEQSTHKKISFTTTGIYSAIAASENIRLCCSLATAIFIIMSHMQIPALGCYSLPGTIFGLPPVYLVLTTNISVVVAKIILARGEQGTSSSLLPSSAVDQLGKAVEILMLIQHIAGVLFMDFMLYAFVLISGLILLPR